MSKIKFRHLIVAITVLTILTGCTLPGFSTPTPFSFPTPDKTMTALFEPTQAAPATSASSSSSSGGDDKTATPKVVPTNTPEYTATEDLQATQTAEAAETLEAALTATLTYEGPVVRSGASISADFIDKKLNIDGDLYEWKPPIQKVINYVVFGKENWTGELDCSGTVVAGWDEDYLYIGVRVKDDKYVQEATGEQIYLGDSIEILFDRYVSADYYLQSLSADDYQIGISPGKGGILTYSISSGKVASMSLISPTATTTGDPKPPQAYMWFPKTNAGKKTEIKIGALESGQGYQVEFRIPWSLLGVANPSSGDHYGFALSISDNDKAGTLKQQTVVSNVPTRYYANPTSWGDLYLK
ncbi:MAG: hypothetical protein E4H33_05895 [Anaerolineales bacterium]|nr:MAG: hypothetical protein E4H33_05895 [Anaerolineales bacterium]